ncbi:nitrilase-related carbon-nitrogen hydrolase [Actinomadura formosensis]|uniref:nitrilase-related carbon-nitrogen hydrolase n=1 Tax=Actinomadura formosensis TaxID=60706 RepID=UPI000831BF3F|nr:nitrilase-related carbon-nitrogen hydrolase [Actinomadura formosensis]
MHRRRPRVLLAVAAAAASAALFHLGTGLHPIPVLTWLAALPVLLLAPRTGVGPAAAAAFAAWLGGQTNLWDFYQGEDGLDQPVPLVVGIFLGTAVLFALTVLLARALMLRRRPFAAAVAVPSAWVAVEYAMSMPQGAFWSIGYTQAGVGPVLQIASLTGLWGMTFLILGVPAAVAAITAPGTGPRARVQLGAAAALLVVAALGYGFLRPAAEGPTMKVALIAGPSWDHPIPVETPEGRALVARYAERVRSVAARGAQVIVLPEKLVQADERTLPLLTGPLARAAAGRHVVTGLTLVRNGVTANAALDVTSGTVYRKHHLIPVLEEGYSAGSETAFVPGTRWGLIICKDLDHPALPRAYRGQEARVLLTPALDFGQDAWWHSRVAVTRGVESGLTIVRSATQGALTVSDPYGNVRAEARTGGAALTVLTAEVSTPGVTTLYSRLGDWFAWLCLALTACVTVLALRKRAAGQLPAPRRTGPLTRAGR